MHHRLPVHRRPRCQVVRRSAESFVCGSALLDHTARGDRIDENVPTTMPMIVYANTHTLATDQVQHDARDERRAAGDDCPAQRLVDRRVDHFAARVRQFAAVLADAVHYDDGVVQRVPQDVRIAAITFRSILNGRIINFAATSGYSWYTHAAARPCRWRRSSRAWSWRLPRPSSGTNRTAPRCTPRPAGR